ncbi:MAG TPA: hydroxyacid dehydrogenase [Firmicutes bacterium]|nr:hydroxyacid dehydrogenase [Bacillota bacterium]
MPQPEVVLLIPHRQFRQIVDRETEAALRAAANVRDLGGQGEVEAAALTEALATADAVITSWGSPFLSRELLEQAPRLRFIGHAAGSIKPYVDVWALQKGITVINAARVMARGVAEMTLLFALASLRSLVAYQRENKPAHRWQADQPVEGLFFQRVGLVGLGQVGRAVLELFAPFRCRFQVYDPYLSAEEAARLGVEKTGDLQELFATSRIVSLHAAVTRETAGMIRREHFACMQPGAVFINTARGRLVDYAALVEAAVNGRIRICLDVTDPLEPLPADSPLWDLPNVMITPHIAGPTPDRRVDMGQDVIARLLRFWRGEPIEGVITLEQYERMA